VGRSRGVKGLVVMIVTWWAMDMAVAQNKTWNDCELADRDPDRSIAACSKVLARSSSPARAGAFHNRGLAFKAKGNLDQAISDISSGIRLDSRRPYRWQERGELYTQQGKYQQGIADISEAIQLDPTPRAFRFQTRAEAYRGLGDLTRAIADFDEAIRLDPVPRSFRFADRGNALRDAGQYDRALGDYETALKLAATDAWILLDRGRAYARMGRSQAARNDFNTALTLDPSNEELRRYIATELASPSIRNGTPPPPPSPVLQPLDGLEDVRRKAENGDPIAQLKLGRMYANGTSLAKNDTQAVAWFRKAAERGHADAQYELASSYDTGRGVTKDGALAVDWYRKAAAQGHQDARNRLDERASLIQYLHSTITRIQDELMIIPAELRERVKEVAARLATARDTMPLPDLNALRVEADNATAVLDKATEFRRVSEIASSRIASIEEELAQITSDAPVMREIQDAIESVKIEQKGSNVSSLQGALENLNKLYDTNRGQLQRWKFKVH
jgi:tetratricopeptide (TPR) repeat protein